MARRYRIHFSTQFDYDVDADHIEHARAIANKLASGGDVYQPSLNGNAIDLRCAWVTITPLTPHGTPSEVVFEEKRIDDG